MILPSPLILGLPEKFSKWRPGQAKACQQILNPKPRFLLLAAPTGFGKSIAYVTAATLTKGRTAILTSTKGLQDQLLSDFEDLVDIRGRSNYICRLNTKLTCDHGLCLFGVCCPMRDSGGCLYFDQLRRAKEAKIVVTNYSYWMAQHEYSDGLGEFDLLVLDEAHSTPGHVLNHLGVFFSYKKEKFLGLEGLPDTHELWSEWAILKSYKVDALLERAKKNRNEKQFIKLKKTQKKLSRLRTISEDWVWETSDFGVTLSPIWPAPYTEEVLFLGIPKVVLTSATIVPRTAKLLGISNSLYQEFPHPFAVENRPLIHLPTVRMNYKITEEENKMWIRKVDQIIKTRKDKGIIHTISYARRDMLLEQSKFKDRMMTHNQKDVEGVVRAFKKAKPPRILVSPSMATGWDFPDNTCRWQVIVKLPYPDSRGFIAKARNKQDPLFSSYLTAQQLIQAVGRGTRSETDWCETFILDNSIVWFMWKHKDLMVDWFREAYSVRMTIPKTIER